MARPQMTEAIARAAAMDVGNRAMRLAGRKAWSRSDYNASVREFNRLIPLIADEEVRTRLGVDMPHRRNAPLKGARQIGSNMTEVQHGDLTVLYSYETPVAFLSSQGGYRTEKKWSVTTAKHIGKFFAHHGYDVNGAFKIPQDDLERFVEQGTSNGLSWKGNPSLRFDEYPLRDDKRKKSPPKYSFYQLTLDDVLSPDFGREQLYVQDQQGFMGRVRRNGQVKTWKRDPERVEIPVKFGMYEAFRITDPSELFVMAKDFPINVDPTPAESREVVRRLTRRDNPVGQLWYPGGVAVGRYRMGEAGVRYYVIPVESTHGWDFPTLSGMFPDNLRPDALALVEARLGYEHSGQEGYHLFKVRVNGKWSRPLRLRTSLTELPGVK